MNKQIISKSLIVFVLALSLPAGCGNNVSVSAESIEISVSEIHTEVKPMLPEAELLYEKAEMLPGIQIDLIGYVPEENKIAILEGSILPGYFNVINNTSGEVVFTGVVQSEHADTDEETHYGIADFSKVTEEGTYHIEAELLGRSKDFEISSAIYRDMLAASFEGLSKLQRDSSNPENVPLEEDSAKMIEVSGGWVTNSNGERDVVEACVAVFDLLKAYEYYRKAYEETDILALAKEEVKWLIKMQNPETGGVFSSVSRKNESNEYIVVGETTRATTYFTALMAKCSYVYVNADPAFSKQCLQNAVSGWNCLEANRELVGASQMFRAATELYRATGGKNYLKVIDEYLEVNSNKAYEERIEIDSAMSYMSTSRSVNLAYCTTLMQQFMARTEKLATDSKEARYFWAPGCDDDLKILRNIAELVEADYILTSREYGDIELNYLHYLCGRNPDSTIHNEFSDTPDAYAELILLMGRLLTDNTIK